MRQVEALAQERPQAGGKTIERARGASSARTPTRVALEKRLSDALGPRGRRSTIAATAAACCSVRYRTLEQLDDVIRRLESRPAGDAPVAHPRLLAAEPRALLL